jgi:hypothetical protein
MSKTKKEQIVSFLQCAYSDAKRDDDKELMNSLARATVALNYSGAKKNPTLADMLTEYQQGKGKAETNVPKKKS